MIIYIMCLFLFCIGVYCALVKRNLIKIIIGLGISDYAVNLFLVLFGYKMNGKAPIFEQDPLVSPTVSNMVDPIPQALVLTSIVIGLAVTGLMVAIAIRIYQKYGTFDITEIRRLKG